MPLVVAERVPLADVKLRDVSSRWTKSMLGFESQLRIDVKVIVAPLICRPCGMTTLLICHV
jgi:hypothetical protein